MHRRNLRIDMKDLNAHLSGGVLELEVETAPLPALSDLGSQIQDRWGAAISEQVIEEVEIILDKKLVSLYIAERLIP